MFIKCPNCHQDHLIDTNTIKALKRLYMGDLVALQEENAELRMKLKKQIHRSDILSNQKKAMKKRYENKK